MPARVGPFSASAPSKGNKILDVATAASQLLTGSMGLPHKLAMVSLAMYEGYAASEGTSVKQLTMGKAGNFSGSPIDLAVSTGYETLFRVLNSEPEKLVLLHARMEYLGIVRDTSAGMLAMAVLKKYRVNMMMPGMPMTNMYTPANPASKGYDADCASLKMGDHWQPQCVQMAPGKPCMVQKVPFNPLFNATLVTFNGSKKVDEIIRVVPDPPMYNGLLSNLLGDDAGDRLKNQHNQVIQTSSNLDDHKKFVAEFFQPNAVHVVTQLTINELQIRNSSVQDSVVLLMGVAAATRDSVVSGATVKLTRDTARPISVIQCGWGGSEINAWRGPYMGTGTLDASEWRPYLQTPSHPGFVSGHSTVATAGTYILAKFFGDDRVHSANCPIQKAGTSRTEPRIEKGNFGYIQGVTDVANKGGRTKGFSPAHDMKICWPSFTRFRQMLVKSREYGGIHIPADNYVGVELGKRVGHFAYKFMMEKTESS